MRDSYDEHRSHESGRPRGGTGQEVEAQAKIGDDEKTQYVVRHNGTVAGCSQRYNRAHERKRKRLTAS